MSALIRQRAARCASPAFSLSARRFPPTFLWLLLFSGFSEALRYQRLINSRSDGGRRRNANLCICLFLTLQGTKCTMLIIYPILTLTESKPTSGWLTLWAVAVELLSVHRCDWMPPLLCTHWSLRIIPELIALLFCSSTDEQFRWNAQGKRTHTHTWNACYYTRNNWFCVSFLLRSDKGLLGCASAPQLKSRDYY